MNKPLSAEQIATITLIKWPQMLVWGQDVTVDQAKEIIFCTDAILTDFYGFCGGNNHQWNGFVRRILGYQELMDYVAKLSNQASMYTSEHAPTFWDGQSEASVFLKKELQIPEVEYVQNSWTSCAFVYGPHGWCHPDGKIAFVDNVGKWPTANQLIAEWNTIAQRFPFLDLHVTLMDQERCDEGERVPQFSIRVCNGSAYAVEPYMPPEDMEQSIDRSDSAFEHLFKLDSRSEVGIPEDWIFEYREKYGSVIDKAVAIGKALADQQYNEWKQRNGNS